jgi:RNA polymerase sigma factor (sigma-70 family)
MSVRILKTGDDVSQKFGDYGCDTSGWRGGAAFGGVRRVRVVSVEMWVSGAEGTVEDTAKPARDEGDLTLVVAQARAGSGAAWENLLLRFGGLVASIARRCRLNDADVAEVCQTTWLRLVENLDRIEQPERIGAWLATTSRRESLRIATRRAAVSLADAVYLIPDDNLDPLDSGLLKDEQLTMIARATQRLAPHCQRLLGLLMSDDDLPYKEIAQLLSMPVGSIGPTRGRCLEHLRQILAETEVTQASA